MKQIKQLLYTVISFVAFTCVSCSDFEIPDHSLDIEYRYELTCSNDLLNYVTPEVTITDIQGNTRTLVLEDNLWHGDKHKTWSMSVHYDSLNVQNTMTVRYVEKSGVMYKDQSKFDNTHNLSCLIIVQEDGDGRRNNYTIIPDFETQNDVSAETLKKYISKLTTAETTRGGKVGMDGEIVKIENDK